MVSTIITALNDSAFTDLGPGPMFLGASNNIIYQIADSQPAATPEGFYLDGGLPVVVQATSHIWAIASTTNPTYAATTPITGWGSSLGSITWTSTIVTLAAATSTLLIAANTSRRALRWMNIGANPMTVAPGTGTVTAGSGMNYNPPPSTLFQGGSDSFGPNEGSTQAFSAISTSGTTVVVWEGQ